MRRYFIALVLLGTLALSGCAASDLFYSLFSSTNSNQADMNARNPRNNDTSSANWMAGSLDSTNNSTGQ